MTVPGEMPNRIRPTGAAARFAFLLLLSVPVSTSCDSGSDASMAGGAVQDEAPQVVLQVSIGENPAAPPAYQFAAIKEVSVGRDGFIWVADGGVPVDAAVGSHRPSIRRFTPDGVFDREVGGVGTGPGEYRQPEGLAVFPDGRMVMRDLAIPNRLTIYGADGTLADVWTLSSGHYWTSNSGNALAVDTAGTLWLPFNHRPGPDRPPPGYLVLSSEGVPQDTVPFPAIPSLDRESVEISHVSPSGAVSVRRLELPHQAYWLWARSPTGEMATALSDAYSISIRSATTPDSGAAVFGTDRRPGQTIRRTLDPVSVTTAERRAIRKRILDEIERFGGNAVVRMSAIAETKPALQSLMYSEDGALLVFVSMPSILNRGQWREPHAFDLYSRQGQLRGRVLMPEGFRLMSLQNDMMWGVHTRDDGMESIRGYRLVWNHRRNRDTEGDL